MDIPLAPLGRTGATASIAPISTVQVQATAPTPASVLIAQTTVDLSPLGRFLSAVTLFQKRLLELQANPSTVATQADSDEALAAVASSAVALSESANDLQASLITGTSDDQSLATLFSQQLNAKDSGADADVDGRTALAAIGLRFTSDPGQADVLSVDAAVLQAALVAAPAGTAALLERTATAFGTLASVAAQAGAAPTALLADDSAATETAPTAPASAQSGQSGQSLPELADPIPSFSTDGAFLQELLAETPKPALALSQAPPPAVAEANAVFAAERAAEADVASTAPPLPAQLPNPATDLAAATASSAARPAPPAPDLAPTASEVAVGASASLGAPRPASVEADNPAQQQQASRQAANAQAARTLAEQGVASRIEARDGNNRIADSITAERDANQRLTGAIANERAAQMGGRETQALADAAAMRATDNAQALRRMDGDTAQSRLDQPLQANRLADDEVNPDSALRERVAAALGQPLPPAGQSDALPIARAQPLPVNNAQQLARDPAIAAAIAAYNLNAGPFAALNARAEIAAQRPKAVAAVDAVTGVAAIETDAATSDTARPFR